MFFKSTIRVSFHMLDYNVFLKKVLLLNKFRMISLLNKYGVQLLHTEVGELSVHIGAWERYEEKLHTIIAHLREEKHIHRIDVADQTVTIQFEPSLIQDLTYINHLLTYIDRYDL